LIYPRRTGIFPNWIIKKKNRIISGKSGNVIKKSGIVPGKNRKMISRVQKTRRKRSKTVGTG
jgi:hypothetical protein